MKNVAVLSDRMAVYRGSARVALAISRIFDAPIFTYSSKIDPELKRTLEEERTEITTGSGLPERMPSSLSQVLYWRRMKPLDYDCIISVGPYSKSYRKGEGQTHISYFNSPLNDIWQDREDAIEDLGFPRGLAWRVVSLMLREWERNHIELVNVLIANSLYTQELARKFWEKDVEMIYPPVSVSKFHFTEFGDFYLCLSKGRKKDVGEIIRAFAGSSEKLKLIGIRNLEFSRDHENIDVLGWISESEKGELLSRCRGVVCSTWREHFGIIPVEVMASGKPVVAPKKGGFKETIIEEETGVFFPRFESEEIARAVERCESTTWNPKDIQKHAKKFDESIFKERILEVVSRFI